MHTRLAGFTQNIEFPSYNIYTLISVVEIDVELCN